MTLEPNLSGWSVISPSMLLNHAERNGIEAESESARIGDQEYRRVRAAPEPPRTLVDYWQLPRGPQRTTYCYRISGSSLRFRSKQHISSLLFRSFRFLKACPWNLA